MYSEKAYVEKLKSILEGYEMAYIAVYIKAHCHTRPSMKGSGRSHRHGTVFWSFFKEQVATVHFKFSEYSNTLVKRE